MAQQRLYRSNTDAVIAGVAGGFANHLGTDPVWIRLLFVVLALAGGGGVLIYLILWIFIPKESEMFSEYKEEYQMNRDDREQSNDKQNGNLVAGLILITLGSIFLIDRYIPRIDFGDIWPFLLIVAGAGLLIGAVKKR